jgi:hypothetical protein
MARYPGRTDVQYLTLGIFGRMTCAESDPCAGDHEVTYTLTALECNRRRDVSNLAKPSGQSSRNASSELRFARE